MKSPPENSGASLLNLEQGRVLNDLIGKLVKYYKVERSLDWRPDESCSGLGDRNLSKGGVKGNECASETPSAPDLNNLNGAGLLFMKSQPIRPHDIECGICNLSVPDSSLRCPNCGACLFC